ncbi:hypothetical protein [Pseudomonas chlororaphis]|nr:hypothetical protein [Pseudomonas chlororaphis]
MDNMTMTTSFNRFCDRYFLTRGRRLYAVGMLVALANVSLSVQAAEKHIEAADKVTCVTTDRFKVCSYPIRPVSYFTRQTEAVFSITLLKPYVQKGQHTIAICANGQSSEDGEWGEWGEEPDESTKILFSQIKQHKLANYIHPKSTIDGDGYTAFSVNWNYKVGTKYFVRLPIKIPADSQHFQGGEHSIGLGVSGDHPLAMPNMNCDLAPGDKDKNGIHITRAFTVLAPEQVKPIVKTNHEVPLTVESDQTHFVMDIDVLGAQKADTVEWDDGTKIPFTQKDVLKETDDGKTIEVGYRYQAVLPIPTKRDYKAGIRISNAQGMRVEREVVGGVDTSPVVSIDQCESSRCRIYWKAPIPYRNIDDSLGLNLQTMKEQNLPGAAALPEQIFSLNEKSGWDYYESFKGVKDDNKPTVDRFKYMSGSLLTPSIMPSRGVFSLVYEKD